MIIEVENIDEWDEKTRSKLFNTDWYDHDDRSTPHVPPDTYAEEQPIKLVSKGEVVFVPMRGSKLSIACRYRWVENYSSSPFVYSYHFVKWLGERMARRTVRTGERVVALHGNKNVGGYYYGRFSGRNSLEMLNYYFRSEIARLTGRDWEDVRENVRCFAGYDALVFVVAANKEQYNAVLPLVWELGDVLNTNLSPHKAREALSNDPS